MLNKFKKAFLILSGSLLLMFGLAAAPAYADCLNPTTPQEAAQCGACNGAGAGEADCAAAAKNSTDSLNNTIKNIINLLTIFGGIIAVIMIIYAGFRYVTASGNDQTIATAKKILIYAVIGLVIIAMAQVIAKFTLTHATNASGGSSTAPAAGSGHK